MTSTNWAPVASEATYWEGSYYIVLLGVIMDDTGYTMNDTVATMNDQQINPDITPPTNYSGVSTNSTNWS